MAGMSHEIELKFRIPADRLAGLRQDLATARTRVLPLAAAYFDTPGEHLARARTALRLRREGPQWVQTLKAEGASAMQRLEHNVPVGPADGAVRRPALRTDRHAGTEAGAALTRLLAAAGDGQPLQLRYRTEVQRTLRVVRSGGAAIELALDEGRIVAGRRQLALREIEFELLSGPPQALLALAARWARRHRLVLDVRSKSERGHGLAAGLVASPPAALRAPRLPRTATAAQRQAEALRQVLANASQVAEGPSEPAHARALCQGLQRLADGGSGEPLAAALRLLRAALMAPEAPLQPLLQAPATQALWLAALAAGLTA